MAPTITKKFRELANAKHCYLCNYGTKHALVTFSDYKETYQVPVCLSCIASWKMNYELDNGVLELETSEPTPPSGEIDW